MSMGPEPHRAGRNKKDGAPNEWPPVLDDLADLAANHKLVPFLGAGCSIGHLNIDWDGLVSQMAREVGSRETGRLEVAQDFVDARGKEGLAAFLRHHLLAEAFRDDVGSAHLSVLALGVGVVYTTNQDNVFELAAAKYGRPWRKIIQIEDLVDYRPGDRVYVKYHGDLANPESLVYTREDYENRIKDSGNFLNIRIRSDLLAKQFLFIGYSFRDGTIHATFQELKAAFGGVIPPSYLLAYRASDELDTLCQEYGVQMLNPVELCPQADSHAEAFSRCLGALSDKAFQKKLDADIASIFDNPSPRPERVLLAYELDALEADLPTRSVAEGAKRFRAILDDTLIPKDFEERVANLVLELSSRCASEGDSDQLASTLLHLRISDPELRLRLLIAAYATANVREPPEAIGGWFGPIMEMNDYADLRPVIVAGAIKLVRSRGEAFTPAFFDHVARWLDREPQVDAFDEPIRQFIKEELDEMWKTKTTHEHPIERQRRLGKSLPQPRGLSKIHDAMTRAIPKVLRIPPE